MSKRQSYEYYIYTVCVVSHIILCTKFSCNCPCSFFFSGTFLELAFKPSALSSITSSHKTTFLFLTQPTSVMSSREIYLVSPENHWSHCAQTSSRQLINIKEMSYFFFFFLLCNVNWTLLESCITLGVVLNPICLKQLLGQAYHWPFFSPQIKLAEDDTYHGQAIWGDYTTV